MVTLQTRSLMVLSAQPGSATVQPSYYAPPSPPHFFAVVWVMKYSPSGYQVKPHGTSLGLSDVVKEGNSSKQQWSSTGGFQQDRSAALAALLPAGVCISNEPARPLICIRALTVHLSVVATAPWWLLLSPWWGDDGDVLGTSGRSERWRAGGLLCGSLPSETQRWNGQPGEGKNGDGAFNRRLVRGSTSVRWPDSSSLTKSAHHLKK